MGDDITQPTHSAELVRAKYLQEALRRDLPRTLVAPGHSLNAPPPAWEENDPAIQRAYLEHLLEGTPEAIAVQDAAHHVVRVNSEFTRLFGFKATEAIGRRLSELIVPPDRSAET